MRIIKLTCLITSLACQSLFSQNIGEIGKGKAFDKGGSLGIGCMLTSQQGVSARRVPFSWYVSGSPTLKFYDITIPFSFVWSEQERSFSQPFNKYGASPFYKWITIHAGWRNISYSDYTLAGATFLGGGFDLNPGNIRVGAIYGKFRNKVTVDGENRSRFSYLLPAYERWGYAGKIGYGKGPNFTDLIFFKGYDKIDNELMPFADSAFVKPQENIAIGLKSNYTILKNIDINIDFGLSAVTLDTRLSDSIPIDASIQQFSKIIKINQSTVPYIAGTSSISYSLKKIKLRAEYKRVDPQYQTMGNYYVANDIQQYTLSPILMLLKNKIIINGSYGIRNNNLLKEQSNTTVNKIGSAYITIAPKPNFGLSMNYSNYGTSLNNGQTQLNDSIVFSIINQSAGASIRYSKTIADKTNSVVLNGQFQRLNDNNIVTQKFSESQTITGSISYNYGRGKKGFNAGGNLNFTQVSVYNKEFQLLGPSFNIRKNFKQIKLNFGSNLSYQMKFGNGKSDGSILNLGCTFGYAPAKKHNFNLMANALINSTTNASIYSYNEQRITLRYNYQL